MPTPTVVQIRLKQSNTAPFRMGANVILGRTDGDVSPVSVILAYPVVRRNSPGQLFVFEDGSTLSRRKLVDELQHA